MQGSQKNSNSMQVFIILNSFYEFLKLKQCVHIYVAMDYAHFHKSIHMHIHVCICMYAYVAAKLIQNWITFCIT